ncbi:hypothetical protein PR202_gb28175 [Eleusine coracana subsp. coracana]|uniref:Polymerase nucleotidyl transferase domain-containing protein n=1 Tax=Eleusine coracana subsp. coracana TaxID=191504 RepID=A0AAV5FWB8_ELECO|nr:hypothetical protein PR202_gb28175 [Eleusine coracana subsp. coracana]
MYVKSKKHRVPSAKFSPPQTKTGPDQTGIQAHHGSGHSSPFPTNHRRVAPTMAFASASPRTTRELLDALTAHLSLYHAANPSPAASSSSSPSTSPRAPRSSGGLAPSPDRARRRRHLAPLPSAAAALSLHAPPPSASGATPPSSSSTRRPRARTSPPCSRASPVASWLALPRAPGRVRSYSPTSSLLSSPALSRCPDAITVAEALFADLDGFVAAMDEISGGRFLCCGEGEVDLLALACEDFPELPWLNAKGYYAIEEFVANRVEIALRMSWAAAGGGAGGGRKDGEGWGRTENPLIVETLLVNTHGSPFSGRIVLVPFVLRTFCLLRGLLMVVSTESINLELIEDGVSKAPKKKDVEKTSGGSRKGKKKSNSSKKLTVSSKPNKDQSVGCNDHKNHCNKKKSKRKGKTKPSNLMRPENLGSNKLKKGASHAAVEASHKPIEEFVESPHLPSHVSPFRSEIPEGVSCLDSSILLNKMKEKACRNSTKQEDTLYSPRVDSSAVTKQYTSVHESDAFDMNEQTTSNVSHNDSVVQSSSCSLSKNDNVSSNKLYRDSINSLESSAQDKNGSDDKHVDHKSIMAMDKVLPSVPASVSTLKSSLSNNGAVVKNNGGEYYVYNRGLPGGTSYEWPSVTPSHCISPELQHRPAAADRLHLDVGYKWPTQFNQPFLPPNHQIRNPPVEAGCNQILPSLAVPLSFDWPPAFRGYSKLSHDAALSYDQLYTPQLQSSPWSGIPAQLMQRGGICSDKDRKYFGDSDVGEDAESFWFSEEESDARAHSGRDINQYFGGGVMYWSPAEHAGTGFSRPPSLSSDDSAWAWHEADVIRVVDDVANGIPSTLNGVSSSPPSTPSCSQNESLDPVTQSITGTDINNEALPSASPMHDSPEDKTASIVKSPPCGSEVVKGDTLPYAMLRPIVVPSISRRSSRSDVKGSHDHRSPCVPSNRRDIPVLRRPPSPVVLSVPRVPRPPPPSPAGESRKRGFPIVRSGSSSPRHWGMRGLFAEDKIFHRAQFCLDGPEVVWPSWGNKGTSPGTLVQSIEDTVLQDHLVKISQMSRDQHPDMALPVQPADMLNGSSHKVPLSLMHNVLHEEINQFCKQVASGNLVRRPYINWAVKRVTRCLQDLWPRSRTNLFGSNATGLALPTSDVDLVVSLPPVRNLEPIKEAGILEGRNGIKETCLQSQRVLLKGTLEHCTLQGKKHIKDSSPAISVSSFLYHLQIPVIMLVADVPCDTNTSSEYPSVLDSSQEYPVNMIGEQGSPPRSDTSSSEGSNMLACSKMNKDDCDTVQSIRLDISFKSASHTGLQTTELVRELTQQFPAVVPLALILKKFLADRSLDHPYSGGLSSYCLVLLIVRFLQHEHHLGRPINQNLNGRNIFDPRHMRISIQGSGIYLNRERGHSIDPIHIDDPLCPANNVGRNCFRIHQCIKAFADAFAVLENELMLFSAECSTPTSSFNILKKIIPSIDSDEL